MWKNKELNHLLFNTKHLVFNIAAPLPNKAQEHHCITIFMVHLHQFLQQILVWKKIFGDGVGVFTVR